MSTRPEDVIATRSQTAEASTSAVAWPAIWAGAAVASAASLLLVALGSGLGFASISPWSSEGISAGAFTLMTAIWLIIMQWVAAGLGGFVTGRMRTKWAGVHTHEVAFRDTAHGFVMWAVSTLITAGLIAWASIAAISGGAKLAAATASGVGEAGAAAIASGAGDYEIQTLFRSTSTSGASADERSNAVQILLRGLKQGDVPAEDRKYLAELVAARTGISPAEADQRVNTAIESAKAAETKAREVADAARKTASIAALSTALSMLIGAFIAMVAAALGGRERDLHP